MTHIKNNFKNLKWAIIGGGNGGQSMAGHLAIMGFPVRLYDIFTDTIDAINSQEGIYVEGEVNGFGKLELATMDISLAIAGADIIVVVTPSTAHRDVAKACAPYLEDGQIILLHPGSTFGAFEFKQVLNEENCASKVIISEAQSLIYACRCSSPGHANIFGIKNKLMVAALPSKETQRVIELLNTAFPQMHGGSNVLETSLGNLNAVMHPAPTLLNTSLIESKHEWLYYWEGITPTIGRFVEELDEERILLGEAFNFNLPSIREMYKVLYGVDGNTLSEAVKKNKAYIGVKGQKNLNTRYLLEDIPMGLVPLVSLAKLVNIPTNRMEIIIRLGELLLQKDFYSVGRTVSKLGLSEMSIKDIMIYAETGEKPLLTTK